MAKDRKVKIDLSKVKLDDNKPKEEVKEEVQTPTEVSVKTDVETNERDKTNETTSNDKVTETPADTKLEETVEQVKEETLEYTGKLKEVLTNLEDLFKDLSLATSKNVVNTQKRLMYYIKVHFNNIDNPSELDRDLNILVNKYKELRDEFGKDRTDAVITHKLHLGSEYWNGTDVSRSDYENLITVLEAKYLNSDSKTIDVKKGFKNTELGFVNALERLLG